jgi:hypothetical protein
MQTLPRLAAGVLTLLTTTALAQDPAGSAPDWRAPVHPAIDADGQLRHWAAGPDYKVAFDDGVTFYPVLGAEAPRNLPVRWRTESIDLPGGVPTVGAEAAATEVSAWRYALRHGPVVEVYEVRDEGVEQSFVVEAEAWRSAAPGQDLVVTGRIETELAARPFAAAWRGIDFCDADGAPVVRYGRAIAFDAGGRTTPVETSFDGERVTLSVPGTWLATAVWPVTIDPVLARASASGTGFDRTSYPSVARNDTQDRILVTYSRAMSANDYDLYVHVRDNAFGALALIQSDVTTATTRFSAAGWVRGANRFVVAFQRLTANASDIRVYVHAGGDLGFDTGTTRTVPNGILGQDSEPALASAESGVSAYLVFRRDTSGSGPANTANSEVCGVLVDASAASLGTVRYLHTGPIPNYDAERPSVSGNPDGDGWMVVWQELNYANANDDWDIMGQRIAPDGLLQGEVVLGRASTSSRHKITPCVEGGGGRYLVSWLERPNTGPVVGVTGDRVAVQRFDWPLGGSAAPGLVRDVAVAAQPSLIFGETNRPIAFDHDSNSHWAIAWSGGVHPLEIRRIGFDGRVAEAAALQEAEAGNSFYSPSLCFDDDADEFVAVYAASLGSGHSLVYGRRFERSTLASVAAYGSSCAGVITASNPGVSFARPHAGSEFFSLRLSNGRPNTPAWLIAGFGQAALPLPGAPGCTLLLDPNLPVLTVAVGLTDGAGAFTQPLPLPSTIRDAMIHWQFVQWDGVLSSSRGLSTRID